MTLLLAITASFAGFLITVAAALAIWSHYYARQAEVRVPPDGSFVELADARLHYLDIGSGPPIILVHGLGGQMRNFTYALAERLSGHHRLLIIDRPGAGYSKWKKATDWGLRSHASVINQFIEALELERPLLVGHSLGGAISLAFACEYPNAISGLALLAPLSQSIAEPAPIHRSLVIRSKMVRYLIANTLATPMARRNRVATGRAVFAPEAPPRDFDDKGGSALTARPSAFFAASSELTSVSADLASMVNRYAAIRMPVGILYGTEDKVLSAALHGEQTAAQIPGCELLLIPGGHMIPVTAPDVVAGWIRQQVGRVAG